jgi:crossover junction endodeoxyribonuclease RuvC
MSAEKIILGIDPGTTIMGYGIIRTINNKEVKLIALGAVDLRKTKDQYLKLKEIFNCVTQLIDKFHPDELAIESPFFGKNIQSMLKLGRAQGVAISAALNRAMPIYEYAPRKIKQAITGQGEASKEQVAGFLQNIFKLKDLPKNLDATDGLAAALCHFYEQSSPLNKGGGNLKGWGDFIKNNPDRVN